MSDFPLEPATEPIPVKTGVTLAIISYMNWWGTGKRYFDWPPATDLALGPYSPLLGGYYDSGDPATIDWHIKWAVEHGITVFFVLYDMPTAGSDRVFDDGWMRSKYIDKVRFARAIYLTDGLKMNSTVWMARLRETLERWSSVYFSHPYYFKIDSRPVIQVGAVDGALAWRGSGFVDEALRLVREVPGKYGYDPFVLGDGAWALSADNSMGPEVPLLKARFAKFDVLYNNDFDWNYANFRDKDNAGCGQESYRDYSLDQVKSARVLSTLAGRLGKPFIPTAMPGCNPENLYLTHWYNWCHKLANNTLPLFKSMIDDVKPYVDKTLKMIFINSWNEWTEAHAIEPAKEYGFSYLDAIREVFAASPPSEWPADIAPSGKGYYLEYKPDGSTSSDIPINHAWSVLITNDKLLNASWKNVTSPIFKSAQANALFNEALRAHDAALEAFLKNDLDTATTLAQRALGLLDQAYTTEQEHSQISAITTQVLETVTSSSMLPWVYLIVGCATAALVAVIAISKRRLTKKPQPPRSVS